MSEIDKLVILLDAAKADCDAVAKKAKALKKPKQKGKQPTKEEAAELKKFEADMEKAAIADAEAAAKVEVLQVLCNTGLGFDDINGAIAEKKGGK